MDRIQRRKCRGGVRCLVREHFPASHLGAEAHGLGAARHTHFGLALWQAGGRKQKTHGMTDNTHALGVACAHWPLLLRLPSVGRRRRSVGRADGWPLGRCCRRSGGRRGGGAEDGRSRPKVSKRAFQRPTWGTLLAPAFRPHARCSLGSPPLRPAVGRWAGDRLGFVRMV